MLVVGYDDMWRRYATMRTLTPWGRDKIATISQTIFSNAFSWMKIYEFCFIFHWTLFLMLKSTIFQHWFRYWLGADQATSHYLNQWWKSTRIFWKWLSFDLRTSVGPLPHPDMSLYYIFLRCFCDLKHVYNCALAKCGTRRNPIESACLRQKAKRHPR